MKIRHPGRWLVTLVVLLAAVTWLIKHTFDAVSITRAVLVTYVVSSLVSLFIVSQRRETHPGLVSIVTTAGAAIVGWWVLDVIDVRWWVRWILLGVVATPVMSIANAAFRADVRRAQRRREAQALTITEAVLAHRRVDPYTLYLRPFVSTDRLMAQSLPAEIGAMEHVPVHLDLETVLARSLRRTAPLIGLGRSGEMDEGVARIATTDDHWRQTVLALAQSAEFIVMLPLSRPSTTWELERIVESRLIRRTLFIMPEVPHQAPSGVWASTETADRVFDAGVRMFNAEVHMIDLAKEWLQAMQAAREIHLELPPLAAVGALFTIDPDTGTMKDILPLGLSTLMRPIRYLHWCVERLGLLPSKKIGSMQPEQAFAEAVFLGGRTLEFALMRAADGMAVWGHGAVAVQLLHQALDEGQPDAPFVRGYFEAFPTWIKERVDNGDETAVSRYIDFTHQLQQDGRLAPLVNDKTLNGIKRLVDGSDVGH